MKDINKTPLIANWIFKLILPTNDLEYLLGDYQSVYAYILGKNGKVSALIWYWSQLFKSAPIYIFLLMYWRISMFKNYLKIAFRNIIKHKGYTFINVFGLAIGMACCIFILAYIIDEISFDTFHKKAENIYRVNTTGIVSGRTIETGTVPAPMAQAMINDFPEVLDAVRFRSQGNVMMSYKEKKYFESGLLYTDNSIFDIFSFNLILGDQNTALKAPYTVVITQEIAHKYFGNENPVGKIIRLDNNEDFSITGIIEKIPANSHLNFDMLASYETLYKRRPESLGWLGWNHQTYVLLREGVDYKLFDEKFKIFNDKYLGEIMKQLGGEVKNYLQPLTSIHLYSKAEVEIGTNSDIRNIYTFAAIALFILLIACINFMNLSTARSANRAKEVGLRKVVGADRGMLINQFLGESFLLAVISVLIALGFVALFNNYFNNLIGREISINIFSEQLIIFGLLIIIVFVGLIAGSYPAFFLSGFKPSSVLKGEYNKGVKNSRFRSILVVFQFAISITLIIGSIIVSNQLDFMRNKRLGFNKEQQLVLRITDDEVERKLKSIKSTMLDISGVKSACGSEMVPGEDSFNTNVYYPEGLSDDQSILMQNFEIDDDFLENYGIELSAGRGFLKEMSTDQENSILINESAAKKLNWDNPIGKKIYILTSNQEISKRKPMTVIGMIKDIHHRSLHYAVEPTLIDYSPDSADRITLKLNTQNISETMASIEEQWNKIAPNHPFDYFFLDDYFNSLYESEENLGTIIGVFTFFAIIIGCLGLFGLVSFAAEQRTKEIGIRKVLGSSVTSIVMILCKEFFVLVIIANIFAWPTAYFMMKKWLEIFPYQTELQLVTFFYAGFVAIFIALLTVSYRSLKAAFSNPIDVLKYE
jgi:putative ABC transport system permease protein